jgi:hypothetical protein
MADGDLVETPKGEGNGLKAVAGTVQATLMRFGQRKEAAATEGELNACENSEDESLYPTTPSRSEARLLASKRPSTTT